MCSTHTHSLKDKHDHKHNPSGSCCSTTKITSIKPITSDGCCTISDTSSDSCCGDSAADDPDDSDSSLVSKTSSHTLSWFVSGMDCPSCARKLETAINSLTNVQQARVVFATEKLVVQIDEPNHGTLVEQKAEQTGFPLTSTQKAANASSSVEQPSFWKNNLTLLILLVLMAMSLVVEQFSEVYGHLSFTLATVWGLIPIARKAIQLAKSGTPFAIETLMSVAAVGALYLGETVEAAMVILLFMIGEHLEAYASSRARSGVKALMALVPEQAVRISESGVRESVDAGELQPGDVVEVAPGSRLPADGVLLTKNASFDESALTGESVPVEKSKGDQLMAGCVAADKVVQLTITSKQGENAIDRILHLIEEAESRKAPLERFLDKFSRWYTPAMMVLSLLVIITPPLLFSQPWETWVYRGLALLLIACPCALVISTPAAITSGLAAAAKRGALIKGGAALEQLGKVEVVAFDKTGTLTEGKPTVTDVVVLENKAIFTESELLKLAAAVEIGSTHPLAKAVVTHAEHQGIEVVEALHRETMVGSGVKGEIKGEIFSLQSPARADMPVSDDAQSQVAQLENQGKTVVIATLSNQVVGLLAWRDGLRSDTAAAVQQLSNLGVSSVMLTGDNPRAAKAIAGELNMGFRASLLPADKVKEVENSAKDKHVAMVGDGINDAPAMKAASIGIAMGGGTDVALETADAALTHNRVAELPAMIALSRATLSNIRQNIFLALGLKGVFLVTTLFGVTGLWVAVLADSGATALVTLNALRLLKFKYKED
ncbi:zinc/cadmium/mercury/lead-transporting ATPase [Vibrio sp. Of7-15]|uniref:zinc/cadmium/mercury/lead-transporting ATPase n=1 Tax=Vibrio sp. Of7-15 TaxID=2724879 RepID=UPI001EF2261C|nr:zinc/cadmium/mercury/lead-transporting ATPase [Vibrio sp. Of7-15]MCG7497668.1 zinc/cadmium/mercury/lead-transporting ATPase [Vibrio sp. Of7-15]